MSFDIETGYYHRRREEWTPAHAREHFYRTTLPYVVGTGWDYIKRNYGPGTDYFDTSVGAYVARNHGKRKEPGSGGTKRPAQIEGSPQRRSGRYESPPSTQGHTTQESVTPLLSQVSNINNVNSSNMSRIAVPVRMVEEQPSSKSSKRSIGKLQSLSYSLVSEMFPKVHFQATDGNLLLGIKCENVIGTISDTHFSFNGRRAHQGNGTFTLHRYMFAPGTHKTLKRDLITTGHNTGSTTGANVSYVNTTSAKLPSNWVDSDYFANGHVFHYLYPFNFKIDANGANYKHLGSTRLDMVGRSWEKDCFVNKDIPIFANGSVHQALKGTTIYPDFQICQNSVQLHYNGKHIDAANISTEKGANYDATSNNNDKIRGLSVNSGHMTSCNGRQGLIEIGGFTDGRILAHIATAAYQNQIVQHKLFGAKWHSANHDFDFDGSGHMLGNDSGTIAREYLDPSEYSAADPQSQGYLTPIGRPIPLQYRVEDTLHLSNPGEVAIYYEIMTFEFIGEDETTTVEMDVFHDVDPPLNLHSDPSYYEDKYIIPLWQRDLDEQSKKKSQKNGFFSAGTELNFKPKLVHDVGSRPSQKGLNDQWKYVASKGGRLESLQTVSHTFCKTDIISCKNFISDELVFPDTQNVYEVPRYVGGVLKSEGQNGEWGNLFDRMTVTQYHEGDSTGATGADPIKQLGRPLNGTDIRINKFLTGHTYRHVVRWFGVKSYAKLRKDEVTADMYVRSNEATLTISRDFDIKAVTGTHKQGKDMRKKLRFGPVNDPAIADFTAIGADNPLTINKFTYSNTTADDKEAVHPDPKAEDMVSAEE